MKKFIYFLSALALMAGFTACEEQDGGDFDFSEVVLDGFYVYGDATGSTKVLAANSMSAGNNEAVDGKPVRSGMYEKYVWLEADKEFALVYNSAGTMTFYGADLVEVNYGYDEKNPDDCKNFAENPNMLIQQGILIIGEDAPKMKVKESGLYHVVLDDNTLGDLADAQIIVQKADWGVRGGMNSWGFTPGTAVKNADGSITYTWKDQNLAANGEFKFASCHGWKINLDEDGKVKAEVGLGLTEGKLSHTGDNIVAGEKGGLYEITLTYKAKAGAIADSFTYTCVLTQESTTPTTMHIIGNDFGNWDWNAESVVEMTPVHSHEGCFWAVRYMTADTEFKFCALREWNGDFTGLDTNSGFVTPGNNKVEAAGLYMIYVDLLGKAVSVEPAKIYGMGDAFGGWNEATYEFTNGQTATITTTAAGNLRMYALEPAGVTAADWWQMEFNLYDGKIEYRAGGNDQAAVAVSAGQTVTLDFNAGTGSIK